MSRIHFSLALVVLTLLCCGKNGSISGQYLSKFTDGIGFLQLVETPDRHVTGQLETVTVDSNGKLDTKSVQVAGAVDGQNITLTLGESSLLSRALPASRTLARGKLTLTYGPQSTISLQPLSLSVQIKKTLKLKQTSSMPRLVKSRMPRERLACLNSKVKLAQNWSKTNIIS